MEKEKAAPFDFGLFSGNYIVFAIRWKECICCLYVSSEIKEGEGSEKTD